MDAARAAVDTAQLNLGYTRVYSPIDGLVGTTQVKAGNLVGRGKATLLTTVSQINPIIFKIAITEADYLRVVKRRPGQTGEAPKADDIELTLADGTVHPFSGRVGVVDRRARDEMLEATDTDVAPWFIVKSDDKRRARLNTIAFLLKQIPHHGIKHAKVKLPRRSQKYAYDDEATLAGRRFVPMPY